MPLREQMRRSGAAAYANSMRTRCGTVAAIDVVCAGTRSGRGGRQCARNATGRARCDWGRRAGRVRVAQGDQWLASDGWDEGRPAPACRCQRGVSRQDRSIQRECAGTAGVPTVRRSYDYHYAGNEHRLGRERDGAEPPGKELRRFHWRGLGTSHNDRGQTLGRGGGRCLRPPLTC
jgi:hypothetical protein